MKDITTIGIDLGRVDNYLSHSQIAPTHTKER